MGLILLTALTVVISLNLLLVGGLAIWGCPRRSRYLPPPCKDSRGAMNAKNVHVDLQYGRIEMKFFFRYAKAHDVELGGRYDTRIPSCLNIWTHNWVNSGCRAESSLMFSLEVDCDTASLTSVKVQPGFDWQVFLDELARLEEAALGGVMYGKRCCQPKM
jgi:hypothetical protein